MEIGEVIRTRRNERETRIQPQTPIPSCLSAIKNTKKKNIAKLRSYPRDVHLTQCSHMGLQSPQKLTPSSSLPLLKESHNRPNQTFNFMALSHRKLKSVQKIHFATGKKEQNERYYQSWGLWRRNKWMGGISMSMKLLGGAKLLVCMKQVTR